MSFTSSDFKDPKGGGVKFPVLGKAPVNIKGLNIGDYIVGVGTPFPMSSSGSADPSAIGSLAYDGWITAGGGVVNGWLYYVTFYPITIQNKKDSLLSVLRIRSGEDINARLSRLGPQKELYAINFDAKSSKSILGIELQEIPSLLSRTGKFFESSGRGKGRVWFLIDTTSGSISGRERYQNNSGNYEIRPIISPGSPSIEVQESPSVSEKTTAAPARAGEDNKVPFINSSGEHALVKIVGPTTKTVDVPSDVSKTIHVAHGEYYILIRYGTNGKFRYEKGDLFQIKQTQTSVSNVSITLHKVFGGNYHSYPILNNEFYQ
jgi:hypothetical protein